MAKGTRSVDGRLTRTPGGDNCGSGASAGGPCGREAPRSLTALGLMSGTSMDGIDAALLTTDGETITGFGPMATYPYPARFRNRLREMLGREPGPDSARVIADLTRRHADAVKRLLAVAGLTPAAVDVIGFHGHTVVHRPELRVTRQVGDGQLLADLTGIPVVSDFRAADVAAGGHGAPLAPLYHVARARALERPLCVLNIGGVANVTWVGADLAAPAQQTAPEAPAVIAFDTGPGNALVDDWVRRVAGQRWDERGRLARGGRIHSGLIRDWLADPYFAGPPPKSLDRNSYTRVLEDVRALSAEDGAATLTAFTAEAVAASRHFLPAPPARWLICGGGRRNLTLMGMLAAALAAPVEPVEQVGWDGDALEAQAFAFLAVRSVYGLALSLPATTGVSSPLTGGVIWQPATAAPGDADAQTAAASTRSM